MRRLLLAAALCAAVPSFAQTKQPDVEDCKDHPLFTRMPGFYISDCQYLQFDLRRYPQGDINPNADPPGAKNVEVEGPFWSLTYTLQEGAAQPSTLQIRRNFENAAKRAGATIEGIYPGWCKGNLDDSLRVGNGCMNDGVTIRFQKGGQELWAYVQPSNEGATYDIRISQRTAMSQDIVATDLLEKLNKEGFVALYLNFDTGKATLQQGSLSQVDQIADMLKQNPSLKLEVAGHTDNQGTEKSNQKLSEGRAATVVNALVERGVERSRLTAKGYGQSQPVADNRTEDGRAKNRRVELVKK